MTDPETVAAEVIEATGTCSLEEVCQVCRVEAEWVAALVEHGVISPAGNARAEWTFARVSLIRVGKAKRLQHDLGLNVPGLALALDLLDEIEALRVRLRAYGET